MKKWNSEQGSVLLALVVLMGLVLLLMGMVVYKSATVNLNASRFATIQTELTSFEDEISRRVLHEIPNAVYQSLNGNSSPFNNGNIDFDQIFVDAVVGAAGSASHHNTLQYQPGFVNADWTNGLMWRFSNTLENVSSIDLLASSLIPWGSGPVGFGGSSDVFTYPESLFGLFSPGEQFIARRYSWVASVAVVDRRDHEANGNAERVFSIKRRYTLYEVPFQSSLMANNRLNVDASSVTINGGVYGRYVVLKQGVNIQKNATSSEGIQLENNVRVNEAQQTLSTSWGTDRYGAGGTLKDRQLTLEQPLSALFLSIAPEDRYYCSSANATPTNWELYVLPYYRTVVRIDIANADPVNPHVVLQIYDPANVAGGGAGTPRYSFQYNASNWLQQSFLEFTVASPTVSRRDVLSIDPTAMAAGLGVATGEPLDIFNTVYVGQNSNELPNPNNELGVSLVNCRDLGSDFPSGFTLVTRQRFYYEGSFNDVNPVPCSVIAPQIRYGLGDQIGRQIDFHGRMGTVTDGAVNTDAKPTTVRYGANSDVVDAASKTINLTETAVPSQLPPITERNWLLFCELIP